jgi:glutamate racemase
MNLLVFDSGIGGLGVVAEIRRLQPAAGIIYLADNALFPYGEQPDEILVRRVIDLIGRAIETLRPAAVVIACNTASTIALEPLRQQFALPFIGCVPPIKPAAAASRTRHIGVLATAATIRRAYLQHLIDAHAADCAIHSLGTPTLAALAEQKFRGRNVDIAPAIAPLFAQADAHLIDAIALGCTHYTFLLDEFRAAHPQITWCDPAPAVARQTRAVTAHLPAAPTTNTALFTAAPASPAIIRENLFRFGYENFALYS